MNICTRFAPSPTGFLHLGNLSIVLPNAFLAYKESGNFLLRIEDTDAKRSNVDFVKAIVEDLQWLGLYQRSYTPQSMVFQSKRNAIYTKHLELLERNNKVYCCFCTQSRLDALKASQQINRQPPRYDGHCRDLSAETIASLKAQGQAYHMRFRVPTQLEITFTDLVKNEQRFQSYHFSDFVIQRSDRTFSFLYCNALDDALMQVTHVIRGEDHLTNTVRQIMILEALGFARLTYAHLPLIIQKTGHTPLSKREGSFSVADFRKRGYLPQAILNYLARLLYTIESNELLTFEELSVNFTFDRIHPSAAQFDIDQLNFWQKQSIRQLSREEFWERLNTEKKVKVPEELKYNFIQTIQPMVTFFIEADDWVDLIFSKPTEYSPVSRQAIRFLSAQQLEELITIFERHQADNAMAIMSNIKNYVASNLKQPDRPKGWKALRSILTDAQSGPELVSLLQLMGVANAQDRLKQALIKFHTQS